VLDKAVLERICGLERGNHKASENFILKSFMVCFFGKVRKMIKKENETNRTCSILAHETDEICIRN